MMRFSANLGFLWADLPLPEAIVAAHRAGFDAVECHWPYDTASAEVARALRGTGLQMLGINTARGRPGENGLAALPGREEEARAAIDHALAYAADVGAKMVHVMAGFAEGSVAEEVYVRNLSYAADQANAFGINILIEPLNRHDAPGYFLRTTGQARAVIASAGKSNLKLMFDCYHVGRTEGDVTTRFKDLLPVIGHVQFAGVPDRGPPDKGELDYATIFRVISATGWTQPLGAEYKPNGPVEETLRWLIAARSAV